MIYIDTNIFIYAIENHPKYGSSCKRVLEDIQANKLKAASSILLLVETINVLNRLNRELRKKRSREMDVSMNIAAIESLPITWLEPNLPIIERASQYNYTINPVDYIHLATMELNQANEIISADGDFDKAGWVSRTDPLGYK